MSAKVQRLRVRYQRGQEVRFVSHLDMMRFWERALRRARLPVAYSEGFTAHAQMALCAPLQVGMTSRAELLDVFLSEPLAAGDFQDRLQAQLPPGMQLLDVSELPVSGPSLQSQIRAAVYGLRLRPGTDMPAVAARVQALLAAESLPWEHKREKDVKRYDLRALVLDARLEADAGVPAGGGTVVAKLRADEGNTGRADQLAVALGIAGDLAGI
ncbi:MAG: TIGR03936 family radical SAM-associated protein, partial [Dehalococcoidia bacterium]